MAAPTLNPTPKTYARQWLYDAIKARMAIAHFARAVGVAPSTVWRWIHRENTPLLGSEEREGIAAALGWDLADVNRRFAAEEQERRSNPGATTANLVRIDEQEQARCGPGGYADLLGLRKPKGDPDQDFPVMGQPLRQVCTAASSAAVLAAFAVSEPIRRVFAEPRCPLHATDDVQALAAACGCELEQRYAAGGGSASCDVAVAMHYALSAWLQQGAQPDQVVAALEAFCGELCIWIGWMAMDAGHVSLAHHALQEAIVHARLAGSPAIEVCAMNNLSVLLIRLGHPQRAHRIAGVALGVGENGGTPWLRALLQLRLAIACGHLGDGRGFNAAAASAQAQFERGPQLGDPIWFRSLTAAEVTGLIGWGQLALGQPQDAAASFHRTSEQLSPASHRALVHYRIQYARAVAQQGDVLQATAIGHRVLPEVVALLSWPIRGDFRRLYEELSRRGAAVPATRDFIHVYDAAMAAGELGTLAHRI